MPVDAAGRGCVSMSCQASLGVVTDVLERDCWPSTAIFTLTSRRTFWQSTWRLVQVPADLVAEAEHCVGILPSTAGAAAAAAAGTEATMGGLASAVEAPDALVLR
jgi:hypothetical protein